MSDNNPTPELKEKNSQVNKVSSDLFTPGPWRVSRHDLKNNDSIYLIVDSTDHDIDIVAFQSENRNMMDANYQLMATAPEMLEAIRETLTAFEKLKIYMDPNVFVPGLEPAIRKMQQSIKKATTINE